MQAIFKIIVPLFIFGLSFVGCQPVDREATQTAVISVTATAESLNPERLETTMNNVSLALNIPNGWWGNVTDGILMVERMHSVEAANPMSGMLVYIFSPSIDNFNMILTTSQSDYNLAYEVLNQVVSMPTEIGLNVLSYGPVAFDWDHQEAAYYLLTDPDGTRTMVIGVEVPNQNSLVVINVSAPFEQKDRLRETLPSLLASLSINGMSLSDAAINDFPTPLDFPERDIEESVSLELIGDS